MAIFNSKLFYQRVSSGLVMNFETATVAGWSFGEIQLPWCHHGALSEKLDGAASIGILSAV